MSSDDIGVERCTWGTLRVKMRRTSLRTWNWHGPSWRRTRGWCLAAANLSGERAARSTVKSTSSSRSHSDRRRFPKSSMAIGNQGTGRGRNVETITQSPSPEWRHYPTTGSSEQREQRVARALHYITKEGLTPSEIAVIDPECYFTFHHSIRALWDALGRPNDRPVN